MKIDLVEFDEEIAQSLEERAEEVLEEAEPEGPLHEQAGAQAAEHRRRAAEVREARAHAGQWFEIKDRPDFGDSLAEQDASGGFAEFVMVKLTRAVLRYQLDGEVIEGLTRSALEAMDPDLGMFLYRRVRDEHASPFLAPPKAANSATPGGST